MVKFTLIPQPLQQLYDNWTTIAKTFHQKTRKYEDYYLSDTQNTDTPFTLEQLERIQGTTGVKSSINRIYSTTSQAIALLARKKLSNRMVAVDDKYKNHAIVIDKIKEGIMIDSYSTVAEEECIKDMLISGMGHTHIVRPQNEYETIFPCLKEHVHSSQVILDINCTDRTLRKMQGYWIDKEIPLAQAQKAYGYLIDQINQLKMNKTDTPVDWSMFIKSAAGNSSDNRRSPENLVYDQSIWVREYYDKLYSKCYLVEDPKLGIRKLFAENLFPMQQSLLQTALRVDEDIYVRKTTVLGDYVIDVTMEPITEWSLTTRFFEWGGKPYKSKGFVHYAIPLQQAYDSVVQMLLLNGWVTANSGWMAPDNSIKPSAVKDWEENLLNPLKIKMYTPVLIGEQLLKPERMQGGNIGNFFPEMMEVFTRGLYEVTGMDPQIMAGMQTSNTIETFSTLSKLETAAMQRIMMQYDHISLAQQQEGIVLIEYIASECRPEVIYNFLDSHGSINEVQFTVESVKEAKLAKYRIVAIPFQVAQTQRLMISQLLFTIAQSTPDAMERKLFIEYALKLQDMPEMDGLLEKMDVVNDTKQQLEGLQEELKRQKQINKQTEDIALRAQYKAKLLEKLISSLEHIAKAESKEIMASQIRQLEQEVKEEKSKNDEKSS
jgi:hypothetical protein